MRLRPMSLRVRILLSSLICMLAALLIQMTLFNASSSRIISRQTRTINESTLANLGDDVYALFKDVENALISVYDHKDFIRALGSQDVSALQRDFASLAYTMALDSFEPSMRLNALYLYTLSHERICTYRHAQTPIYTYPEDIYDNSMKGSDEGVREIVADNPSTMVVTSYYNAKREQRLIRCILRILENGKTPIGYMVCDLDPKGLVELIRKYRYSEEQALWLQPVGKQALVGEAPAEAETAQIMRTTQEALVRSEAASPNGCALYTRQLRKYDLTIFSLLPLSALNANQSALWNSTLGVFAVLVCVFGTLFLLISRSLTLPLTRMLSTMNRIKLGETSLRLPEMKKD